MAEDYLPNPNHYDHRYEITCQELHATQLTFRPSKTNAEKMIVTVRSFLHPSSFKIWGYCSAPQQKYGGSDEIDRIIARLEAFIAPSRMENTPTATKPAPPFTFAESLPMIQNDLVDDHRRNEMRELDYMLSEIGLASLRESSSQASHRGVGFQRNAHALLLRNKDHDSFLH